MTKNFSDFVDPISVTQPTGIDIEYDARFIDIQSLVEGKPEQQYGDVIIEAQEPDWGTVEKLCRQILSESKDIRVFCFYAQALTANYGILGFKKGCEIIHANIGKYWEDLYPKLVDEEDNFDAFYRSGSIGLLIADSGIIKQLNESNIIYSPSKKSYFKMKSVASILINNEDGSYPGGKEKLIEDLRVAYQNNQEELLVLKDALDFLINIESVFEENIKDFHLDFSVVKKPLEVIASLLVRSSDFEENEQETPSIEKVAVPNNTVIRPVTDSQNLDDIKIKDRADVKIVLEKLNIYFRLKEPSHPAPLFIQRLQKLMDMNFYEMLKNISPDSLNNLDMIIGRDDSDPDD
ncbi:type VI secretion system protein TssA [Psychrobacter immobilis]|uniref:type VI secretion system protein TssA n=1 Tax=Psychrobacter immobilis TaxID=498 RepID=UPI001919D9F5|nr:type VI secretion system protein TssA [Psychrobacter immobilis]